MDMENSYLQENRKERERLEQLVGRITDRELSLQLYKEGWTVAVALAHLAFWDQRRLLLIRKWQIEGYTPLGFEDDFTNLINDTLLPFLRALDTRQAAKMAVSTARELDHELEDLSASLRDSLLNSGDRHALNRGIHRKMHLDEIDRLLGYQSFPMKTY
jgi:hypothetical protein